jgi:hypothetical protein
MSPINASIIQKKGERNEYVKEISTDYVPSRRKPYLKYLSVLQRNYENLLKSEKSDQLALQKGVNYAMPVYAARNIQLSNSLPSTQSKIIIRSNKNIT